MAVLGLGGSGHDWSSCATDGTRLVAVDEERIVHKKYGVGTDLLSGLSRRACLDNFGLSAKSVPHAVACDLVPRPFYYSFRDRVTIINHHMAHAYSAFPASGFAEAAVLVSDNSGSLVHGSVTGSSSRVVETITYFMADANGIRVLDKVVGAHYLDGTSESDYYQPGITDNSLGHFYRAASLAVNLKYTASASTFPISEDGKTMGLAPYGDERFIDQVADLVELQPGGAVRIEGSKSRGRLSGSPRADRSKTAPGWLARPRRCSNARCCIARTHCTRGRARRISASPAGLASIA